MQFNFIQQRIQDEILVITNKYDYESEKLDIERSRKKTQIGELKSNTDIFSKFYFFSVLHDFRKTIDNGREASRNERGNRG